jgi:predicted ATPase
VRALGTPALAERLDERLRFAGRRFDAGDRHRTLHDTVAWSHDLLPASSRRAFAHLGVFASTAPLDAATAVCGGDVLADVTTLVDHSLLVREPASSAPARYRLLETLRLFALEQLVEAGEEQAARRAHAAFYEALGSEGGPQLYGPDEYAWVTRLEVEEPNLQAAITWAREHDVTAALRLGVALWEYWDLRWRERFAVGYFESVLADPRLDAPADLRAWGIAALADLTANGGEARRATVWAQEAVAAFRELGDETGLVAALFALGSAYGNAGRLDDADAALTEAMALAARLGDPKVEARGLNHVSFVATRRGDHALAASVSERERERWVAVGSRRGEATGLRHLAVACRYNGELDRARALCDRALELWIELGDAASAAHVRSTMADIARDQGDEAAAVVLYDQALDEFRSIGDRRCTASTFKNLGTIALGRGDLKTSSGLFVDAVRLRDELGDNAGLAECLEGLARSEAAAGRFEEAVVLLGAAGSRRRASGATATTAEAALADATLAAARDALPARRFSAALARGRDLGPDDVVAFTDVLGAATGDYSA